MVLNLSGCFQDETGSGCALKHDYVKCGYFSLFFAIHHNLADI